MANEMYSFVCPHCASAHLNMLDYESLMVLRAGLGLFTIHCSACGRKISLLRPIPSCLANEVTHAAEKVNAGMGHKRAQG
ncbi:UDP-N-acetylmuramoylalanyl-D-glutamate--2,6-diaminopimelate ligase [Adlercreutzia sp. ZJ154]|uniref:UDP-N-acetylmuramoylalanyl-D-glutamate--2, 6-diaminopimelate ligase n=1 Tax=Adlercreutzia sp. ZJ154 TaxID=2709790 RepID=UPI0013EBF00F|nr:UDP-N-acetylmuramoylalanyl-D-glutamate--2,6-diaminopimelate ligase [Adlercreutzia sp. ZJ154]